MAQSHWLDGFSYNVEEWFEGDRYETLAICRSLVLARAAFKEATAEKPSGRFMIRSRTRVVKRDKLVETNLFFEVWSHERVKLDSRGASLVLDVATGNIEFRNAVRIICCVLAAFVCIPDEWRERGQMISLTVCDVVALNNWRLPVSGIILQENSSRSDAQTNACTSRAPATQRWIMLNVLLKRAPFGLRHGSRGHRLEAAELALSVGPLAALAQGKERGEPGGATRGVRGLGQEAPLSKWADDVAASSAVP